MRKMNPCTISLNLLFKTFSNVVVAEMKGKYPSYRVKRIYFSFTNNQCSLLLKANYKSWIKCTHFVPYHMRLLHLGFET